MAGKMNAADSRTRSSISICIVVGLCCFFYILGAWQKSGFGKGDSIAVEITRQTDCGTLPNLNFETHHDGAGIPSEAFSSKVKEIKPCDASYTDYTPCHDQQRAMTFPRNDMIYRRDIALRRMKNCIALSPPPKDIFPGGGTQFPHGADAYIDQLASVIPMANGTVRTALDTGCGVASWGAYLLKRNVLAMSFAPRDSHEAQVQFALERGVPAFIGVLGTIKLPFPSRSFDMAHCSRCLIPWGINDGKYMMEVDRVLRPGGYWVLSGPPINWKTNFQAWQRTKEDLEKEQNSIERTAELLCWEKTYEKGEIAIWRKRINSDSCPGRQDEPHARICEPTSADDVWYKEMETCVTPYPEINSPEEVAGGELKTFPQRLNAIPPRIASGSVSRVSVASYQEDNKLWKKHVKAYKRINKYIDSGRYRNVMDMNAGLGGFAAALESSKLWVMNVVPIIAEKATLGVIYDRGLIGMYHDWCEAFSTYPRTYDLIHANGVFSLYKNICKMEDILLEMDRILRPEGAVIFRDNVDVLIKVKRIVAGMRWNTRIVDHEDGPYVSEKILVAVKQYWTVGSNGTAVN
ncbi:putative methyltransferase PMT2 [Acorus gramineus]|uniref:Methyltransferase n=2 Tax=Acorus gramineus TaxID=55184 RepID=A0AAV9AAI9_ACOGR|nr:putative methyltransferase PMT2 [Acorus gramineus]